MEDIYDKQVYTDTGEITQERNDNGKKTVDLDRLIAGNIRRKLRV